MNVIALAIHNQYKIEEFRRKFPSYQIVTMKNLGFTTAVVETGQSFAENALLKAIALRDFLRERGRSHYIVVAEDSGLYVNALEGVPGLYPARFCGDYSTDTVQHNAILAAMKGIKDRSAHYDCSVVAFLPDQEQPIICSGRTDGSITIEERGEHGFAYDSIFFSNDLQKTFGEATNAERDSVSHYGRAIEELLVKLIDANLGGRDDERCVVG